MAPPHKYTVKNSIRKPNGLVFIPYLRIRMLFTKLIERANAVNSMKTNNTRIGKLAEYLMDRLVYD